MRRSPLPESNQPMCQSTKTQKFPLRDHSDAPLDHLLEEIPKGLNNTTLEITRWTCRQIFSLQLDRHHPKFLVNNLEMTTRAKMTDLTNLST